MDQQDALDLRIQEFYSRDFDESLRLTRLSAAGVVEFLRVQSLIASRISTPSRILDIGGGTGIHSAGLARLGHEVVMIDPIARHVELASATGGFEAKLGDARNLQFEDGTFDAALSFGPLYHLADRNDRLRSLCEAARVVRPGGFVFAAAIPRTARHAALTLGLAPNVPYPQSLVSLLESGMADPSIRFPAGHFHSRSELLDEFEQVGLADVWITGIEGPSGLALSEMDASDSVTITAAIQLAQAADSLPGVSDLSDHILAIGLVR